MSAEKPSETVLQSARLWEAAIEAVPGVFYVLRTNGRLVLWNRQLERVSGYSPDELTRTTPFAFYDESEWPRVQEAIERTFAMGSAELDAGLRARDGRETPYHFTGRRLCHNGELYLVGVGVDMSELHGARLELERSEALFRALTEGARGMTTVVSSEGIILYQSPAIVEILGYAPADVTGRRLLDFLHPDDEFEARNRFELRASGEDLALPDADFRFRHASGGWRCLAIRSSTFNAKLGGIVVNSYDVTEQRAAEQRLGYLALHDSLTGLGNRHLLEQRIESALGRAEREGTKGALLFLDVDRLKIINDSLGHAVGDAVLASLATRFTNVLRQSDTVARHGGDEFIILLEDVSSTDDVAVACQSLHNACAPPFTIDGNELYVTTSIGAVMYPFDGADAATLIGRADTAMYHSKAGGRNRTTFYQPAMTTRLAEEVALEAQLRRALDKNELELHYQPIVTTSDLKLAGFEALLRWNHPSRGLLAPAHFLRIAEEAGLMPRIGDFAIHQALRQLAIWSSLGRRVRIAVNVSAMEIGDIRLLDSIRSAITETGAHPDQLEIELTESAAMETGTAATTMLLALSEIGIGVALDDFGTGYSSLSHLKRLKIARLKIDQTFVRDMTQNSDDAAIVDAVLALARSIGVRAVAEGVETEEQLEMLRARSCDEVQGFLFSAALNAECATAFMQHNLKLR